MKSRNMWTEKEIKTLTTQYPNETKEILENNLHPHNWEQIKIKASKLKIRRSNSFFRETTVDKLLEDKHEAYYWMGFLMADGSFYKNRIKLALKIGDVKHLIRFAKYINATHNMSIYEFHAEVQAKNVDIVPLICSKFDIKQRKTYNPPSVNSILDKDKSLLLSLIIGYIDGDGNLRRQPHNHGCVMDIKVHGSWNNVLNIFNEMIGGNSSAKINSMGYARYTLSRSSTLKNLKHHGLKFNLPMMKRKWDNIY